MSKERDETLAMAAAMLDSPDYAARIKAEFILICYSPTADWLKLKIADLRKLEDASDQSGDLLLCVSQGIGTLLGILVSHLAKPEKASQERIIFALCDEIQSTMIRVVEEKPSR